MKESEIVTELRVRKTIFKFYLEYIYTLGVGDVLFLAKQFPPSDIRSDD